MARGYLWKRSWDTIWLTLTTILGGVTATEFVNLLRSEWNATSCRACEYLASFAVFTTVNLLVWIVSLVLYLYLIGRYGRIDFPLGNHSKRAYLGYLVAILRRSFARGRSRGTNFGSAR